MVEQDIVKKDPENTYNNIRSSILNAQNKIVRSVNAAIVESYWEIGEQIYKECGESDRAEYGKQVLKYLSERLTLEFGKGFTERALRQMRKFYMIFPIRHALRTESLSWTHYRLIMDVENPRAREFYVDECIKSGWSTRQLERHPFVFLRKTANQQV